MRSNRKAGHLKALPVSPYSSMKSVVDDTVTMQIFNLVERFPHISEKKITFYTGIAAGLAHSFMRKVVAKGWIKARQVSARRWLYFMTAEGFAEKSRLTVKYLGNTMRTYRVAQKVIEENLELCKLNGWEKFVVVGNNELAEIAELNITGTGGLTFVGRLVNDSGMAADVKKTGTFSYSEIETLLFDRLLICESGFAEWAAKNNKHVAASKQVDILGKVLEMSF